MQTALVDKAQWARDEGIELHYTTQFCFEAFDAFLTIEDEHTWLRALA